MILPASFLCRLIIYWYKNCFFFMTLDGYHVGIMEKNFTQHFGKWNTQRRFPSSMFMFGESITYIALIITDNLSMKEGSLFVLFLLMRSTEPGCFRSCSWFLWKVFEEEGCIGLVSWCLDFQCRSSWILNDFFTEN